MPYANPPAVSCSDRPHTWQYQQILRNTGGTRITVTERVDWFDGTRQNTRATNYTIEPGGSVNVEPTRWCSAVNAEHTTRTDWSGSDASGNRISLTGPPVRLLPR